MKASLILSVTGALLLAGCVYEAPLGEEHNIPIDPAVLGRQGRAAVLDLACDTFAEGGFRIHALGRDRQDRAVGKTQLLRRHCPGPQDERKIRHRDGTDRPTHDQGSEPRLNGQIEGLLLVEDFLFQRLAEVEAERPEGGRPQ